MKRLFYAIIVFCVLVLSVSFGANPDYLNNFNDLNTWHWAYETIQKLTSRGIISGYPDGSFKPENTITRAEAVKLLMVSLKENSVFSYGIDVCDDVSRFHWVSPYLINGKLYIPLYEDNTFHPDSPITRLDFANGVANALHIQNVILNVDEKDANPELNDISTLDEQSQDNIKFLVDIGLINGYEDATFRPYEYLTRAQACKILSLALIYRENGFNEMMKNTEGWQLFDPATGWNGIVSYNISGDSLKVYTGTNGTEMQLYYNGSFICNIDKNIKTVKNEKLYTRDGKEWDIFFFGEDVVELVTEKAPFIFTIVNHYQNSEYTFSSEFITSYEAVEILKKEFPYTDFEFEKRENNIYCVEYSPSSHNNLGALLAAKSFINNYNEIQVYIGDLKDVISSEEINGNTFERSEFVNSR